MPQRKKKEKREFGYTFLMKHLLPFEFRINTEHVFTFSVRYHIHHQCFLDGRKESTQLLETYLQKKGVDTKKVKSLIQANLSCFNGS